MATSIYEKSKGYNVLTKNCKDYAQFYFNLFTKGYFSR